MNPLPPYAELLHLRFEDREDGPMAVMPFDEDVIGAPGHLHGGAIAGLLEFAAFRSLRLALEDKDVVLKPITVTVDYMRPGTNHETLATATVERLGVKIANVEAVAWQRDRKSPIASARMNFLLERPAQ